jgi:hypothetical protein
MRRAIVLYRSGMVLRGKIDIPLIDWRHYLEPFLDMHNRTSRSQRGSGCSPSTATP